jgi:hypothetical protein
MGRLVGRERQGIVASLLDQFDACVATSSPHLVCLAAEAGWGKTRIIQGFYGRLQQERQPEPAYWPELFQSEHEDPMQERKLIYPAAVTSPAGVKLPWLWLGLRCEEDSGGRRMRALANDRAQLSRHLAALIKTAELRKGDREAMLTVLGELVGAVPGVGQAASIALALKSLAPHLRRRFETALHRASERPQPGLIDVGQTVAEDIEPDLELVRRFISADLPLVIAVDDAHDADASTVRFIGQVMAMRVPVLILATAWPSALAEQTLTAVDGAPADPASFGVLPGA